LGGKITYAAIPVKCPPPGSPGGSRPGDQSAGSGVHRGADRTSACRAVAGRARRGASHRHPRRPGVHM